MVHRLIISYRGTAYAGWQRQTNALAVQQVVEEALGELLDQPMRIFGAGRTDAGVHAEGQVASLQVATRLDPTTLARALNAVLPADVAVRKAPVIKVGTETDAYEQIDASELPATLRGDDVFLALRRFEKPEPFRLELEKHEYQPVADLVVRHTHLETVVAEEGRATTTAYFEIFNNDRQFLAVQLPEEADVLELRVSGKPDFWVTYHVTLDRTASVAMLNDDFNYGPGWGWSYGYAYRPDSSYGSRGRYVYEYDEGTLLLDVVDPQSRQLIWRGSATDEVNFSASPEAKERQINEAVRRMLAKFPPKG